MTEEPLADSDRIDALIAAVLAVHGDRLDESQRVTLRSHAERLRALAAELHQYALVNADEPDFSFQAIDRVDII